MFQILGIDPENLIFDLSYGIRLPEPKFCPEAIAALLKTCFYEKPDKRPDFKAIKYIILTAYSLLHLNSKSVENSLSKHNRHQTPPLIHEIKHHDIHDHYAYHLEGNKQKENTKMGPSQEYQEDDECIETIEYLIMEEDNNTTKTKEDCEGNTELKEEIELTTSASP